MKKFYIKERDAIKAQRLSGCRITKTFVKTGISSKPYYTHTYKNKKRRVGTSSYNISQMISGKF